MVVGMSRILVSQFVSLDGVIEDPVGIETLGRGGWSSRASVGKETRCFGDPGKAVDMRLVDSRTVG